MASLVQLELDEKDKENFQELQQSVGDAQRELATIANKIRTRNAEAKHAALTFAELEPIPDETRSFEQVGKMFLLRPLPELKQKLTETCETATKEVKALDEKKAHVEEVRTSDRCPVGCWHNPCPPAVRARPRVAGLQEDPGRLPGIRQDTHGLDGRCRCQEVVARQHRIGHRKRPCLYRVHRRLNCARATLTALLAGRGAPFVHRLLAAAARSTACVAERPPLFFQAPSVERRPSTVALCMKLCSYSLCYLQVLLCHGVQRCRNSYSYHSYTSYSVTE